MPRFAPFAGLRYDPARVELAKVVAPPYDVVGPVERGALAARLYPRPQRNPGLGKRPQLVPHGPLGAGARRERVYLRLAPGTAGAGLSLIRRGKFPCRTPHP